MNSSEIMPFNVFFFMKFPKARLSSSNINLLKLCHHRIPLTQKKTQLNSQKNFPIERRKKGRNLLFFALPSKRDRIRIELLLIFK